ncbi:hypothetical protein [Actinoplanes regularis]|uniref:hypothetical protein n=1 Tax=Actinoplanes regularis TaxID=52697 RepID=UPI0024A4BE66|nr:hypothetical protein [Actinoplanes regularis]GLW35287.1 hypothetical protein Areg01_82230 [Actinoplanes regularis]
MSDLERRYLRLVRLFYPDGYRHERGTEIVDTYLALATPDRQRPSVADVIDLAVGGLRQRLRSVGATGIRPGARLAGTLALSTTTALAGSGAVLETNPATTPWFGFAQQGPLFSLGVGLWAAWLLAAVVHVVAPGRWTRLAIGSALVLTVAVIPLAAVTGLFRPPVFVLLPQACLGLVALGVPSRPALWLRLPPLAGAAAAASVSAAVLYGGGNEFPGYYGWPAGQVLPGAGVTLLLVTLLIAVGLALRDDFRGAWALLLLLGPIGMLTLRPLAAEIAVGLYGGGPNPTWTTLAAAALVVAVAAFILVALALAARRRFAFTRAAVERCAACGSPTGGDANR